VVLQQWQPGGSGRSDGWRPLSFFSKKLDAAQLKYFAAAARRLSQPQAFPVYA
jgi:hypothetical protein